VQVTNGASQAADFASVAPTASAAAEYPVVWSRLTSCPPESFEKPLARMSEGKRTATPAPAVAPRMSLTELTYSQRVRRRITVPPWARGADAHAGVDVMVAPGGSEDIVPGAMPPGAGGAPGPPAPTPPDDEAPPPGPLDPEIAPMQPPSASAHVSCPRR